MASELKVAVVTPYYRCPQDWLLRCHESVRAQTHPCRHILVADGEPDARADAWDAQHIVTGKNHGDYGDTPRAIGSVSAVGQGFDAIAYLDADNWYTPEHIATLAALHRETGAPVCTSGRNLHRLDGSFLGLCWESNRERFTDTNCLMLIGPAREMGAAWAFVPAGLHPIGDRILWAWIEKRGWKSAHSDARTVGYRTAYAHHYRAFHETPPAGSKRGEDVVKAFHAARKMGFGVLGLPPDTPEAG